MSRGVVKWDDLRVFLEVARQGSIHAAAKRLKLDHSTVCRRIDKLESHLSVKLLDRTQRGIVVRDDAQDILKHIEGMDQHAGSIDDVLAKGGSGGVQTVRIATMEGIASCYVARRIPLLERFAPNVKIELVSVPQMVDLSRKEADIFLSFFNPRMPGLTSKRLADFRLFLYCSDSYAKRYGVPRSQDELADHLFVGYIDDLLAIEAVRWLDEAVKAPRISFHTNSIIAQCNAAVAGLGIVMLPTFVAAGVAGLKRILPDEVSVRRDVWISVRVEQDYLIRIKSVMKFLSQIFKHDRDFLHGKTEELVDP